MNKVRDRYAKFSQAAQEAKDLNKRLHEALTDQLKTLKTLTLSPDEIDASLPNANDLITGMLPPFTGSPVSVNVHFL